MAEQQPGDVRGDSPPGVSEVVGPILFFRGWRGESMDLVAVMAAPSREPAPDVAVTGGGGVAPQQLTAAVGYTVWAYAFSLPSSGGSYTAAGRSYPVAGLIGDDFRLAYVACNGLEHGDRERPLVERNALWQRLARDHADNPFGLLIQGGDQLYADEMLQVNEATRRWEKGEPPGPVDTEALAADLRAFLVTRYLELYSQPEPAWLMARVPSLCMWDDHDICDGWGSLYETQLDSPVGRTVFAVAREAFLVFQHGVRPDEVPAICGDASGESLTWCAELPGLTLIAPDLRSERRPDRVMGEAGWSAFEAALANARGERILVLSSVPALGPRMSWIEAAMGVLPGIQTYEDDLRDQWQSRAHREEWRRFLRVLVDRHEAGTPVTLLSGEIHLATRGTMATSAGPLHQLVASGITHPAPPRAYARVLGWLAWVGDSPLVGHPIRLKPLPGQRRIYAAQRNYLVLAREADRWRAWWELEGDGATPPLCLGGDAETAS
jgi:hypothetical protein